MTSPSAAEESAGPAVAEADRRVRPLPGFDPRGTTGIAGGLALFAAVLVLYLASYSSVPTSDGYAWIGHIGAGDREKMLPAYHALPMYLLFRLRQVLADLGEPVGILPLLQSVNAALAAAAAVMLYGAIRLLGGGIYLGWIGGGLLACSFASWYFANGEQHHFPLVVLQLIFARGARAGPERAVERGIPISLGALNALAIMLHQESVLFGLAPSPCSGRGGRGAPGSATHSGTRWRARRRRWRWPWPSRCGCAGSRRRTRPGAGSSGRCTRTSRSRTPSAAPW